MIVLFTDCTCCVCPLTLMNLSVVSPAPSIYATLSMFSACSCRCHCAVLLSLVSVTHQRISYPSCGCHRTCIKSCFTFGCYKLKQTRLPTYWKAIFLAKLTTAYLLKNLSTVTEPAVARSIFWALLTSTTSKVFSSYSVKECRRRRGIAPHILYLYPRWRWVVGFTRRPLYSRKEIAPLYRRMGGPRRWWWRRRWWRQRRMRRRRCRRWRWRRCCRTVRTTLRFGVSRRRTQLAFRLYRVAFTKYSDIRISALLYVSALLLA